MKILLTGANGNFGQEFKRQSDHPVVAVSRNDWGQLDALFKGVDVVVHAASDLHAPVSLQPEQWIAANITSTATLLQACVAHRVKRFVFTSSCAVYGDSTKTEEELAPRPTSINGVGKHLCELMISSFCKENDIDFNILRIFNMYGGQDRFSIISRIQSAIARQETFILNNDGVAQRDFVHVRDVAATALAVLESPPAFSHINVGTGVSTRISSVVELIGQHFPSLQIAHASRAEAEYSRADTTRLRTVLDRQFISIEQYLSEEFAA